MAVHDPDDRSQLAYLATTKEGRRVYLSRHLTDADLVVPVGRIGFDPILDYCGPWSVLFPGLASREILRGASKPAPRRRRCPPGEAAARSNREESLEVSWLLGTQFHVGVIVGAHGFARAGGRAGNARSASKGSPGSTSTGRFDRNRARDRRRRRGLCRRTGGHARIAGGGPGDSPAAGAAWRQDRRCSRVPPARLDLRCDS